jgi:hypothetical protein
VQLLLAEEREEVLGQVRHVGRPGGGLDVLGGQPVGLDVLPEPDLAEGVIAPRAGQDALLIPLGGPLRCPVGGERACGALPAFGVALAVYVEG